MANPNQPCDPPDPTSATGANAPSATAEPPTEEQVGLFLNNLLTHPVVQQSLAGVRYRVLFAQAIEDLDKAASQTQTGRWSAHIYDYTNNQALDAAADFPQATNASVAPSAAQPLPSAAEWEEAVEIVRRDEQFQAQLNCNLLIAYRPMPALVLQAGLAGDIPRTLTVGLLPAPGSTLSHQIVAVNMVTQRAATFVNGRPDTSLAGPQTCGITPFYCPAPSRGTPGQLWVSWPAVNPVWNFLAIRPAASSGVSGSGLELRYVNYRGKRLLFQAHVPILNVKYDGDACGPYRDWQYDEHCFQCDGTDLAPGFRRANTAPKTACTGSDAGNFTGVALFETECELTLTTEMEAGWYRYIQEWRFHVDGTLRPRFKFTAVSNSCVCNVHNHHVYWRLDFDLNTPGNNLVQEYNNPPIIPNTNWHKKVYEIKRYRDYGRQRKWRVSNTHTGEAYDIVPGPTDGVADLFGRGDFWVVRYHPTEIDDGGSGPGAEAGIDKFVNGELVENQDVVVWYGAHFRHDVSEQGPGECHEVGPTIRLVQW
jgi:hypothetical protein